MWWGYLHTNGTIQVKRHIDYKDILIAKNSDFVVRVIRPFLANDRDDAIRICKEVIESD